MRFFLLFFIFSNYFLNTSNSFLLKNSMMMISDNNYFDIKLFTKNLIDKKGFVILSNKNKKDYKPINQYRPTGNLVYNPEMFENIEKRIE
jgi:hypothetical protein